MNETCARCGSKFECKSDDIAQCQCNTITLSSEVLSYVASKFDNCLCSNCLQELQSEFLDTGSKLLDMTIAPAYREDLKAILDLQKQCYLSEGKLYDDYSIPPLTQNMESIEADFDQGMMFLKGTINEKIIASVRGFVKNETAYIGRLIVKEEFQNKKFGRKLMHFIESQLNHCSRYELFTGSRSKGNIYLYEKLGYSEFKREKVNDKLTIVYMEKHRIIQESFLQT